MTSLTLVALPPADLGHVPGFPVAAMDGLPVFCLADVAVRRWLRGREGEGCQIVIANPGWQPDADLASRALTFPADGRDLDIIAHARAVWEMTHSRDSAGLWHELPRLAWEPLSPGWMAFGDRHCYLISRGSDGRLRLTRWTVHAGNQSGQMAFAREVLDNSVIVDDPVQGQIVAQAYEDGRDVEEFAAWRHPQCTKPSFSRRRPDRELVLAWRAEGARQA